MSVLFLYGGEFVFHFSGYVVRDDVLHVGVHGDSGGVAVDLVCHEASVAGVADEGLGVVGGVCAELWDAESVEPAKLDARLAAGQVYGEVPALSPARNRIIPAAAITKSVGVAPFDPNAEPTQDVGSSDLPRAHRSSLVRRG